MYTATVTDRNDEIVTETFRTLPEARRFADEESAWESCKEVAVTDDAGAQVYWIPGDYS